jgi:acyl-coenzyme A thioesterase PaaI-like protein
MRWPPTSSSCWEAALSSWTWTHNAPSLPSLFLWIIDTISGVASLDIATQFIGVCRGQKPLRVTGRVKKATFKTAFLEADIEDETGTLVATAQSVAKLSRQPTDA